MVVQVESLKNLLQGAHKGFAYELLALEMEVESSKSNKSQQLIENLSKLIQLYMLGVEVLQSNYDSRYRYFSDKIQSLMKKKHVIEELHIASTGLKQVPKEALVEANKNQSEDRKNGHEINIFMSSEQCNIKKIKDLLRKQQLKYQAYRNRMKAALAQQQDNIKQRIIRRKMKSECYSSRNFELSGNALANSPKVNKNQQLNQDIFQESPTKVHKNCRKGSSAEKKKTTLIQI